MPGRQKLEFTWIGKENRPKLDQRTFDNRLIFTYKPVDDLVNQRGQQIVGKQFRLANGECIESFPCS